MREIKFRGKRSDTGGWIYGYLICTPCNSYIDSGLGDTFNPKIIDRETRGQYTGLKDKNGVEIYEGDVIRYFDTGNMFDSDLLECMAQVVFKYARWYGKDITAKGLRCCPDFGHVQEEELEVIGNIYENPELLESK